jgi:hypothetical protein
MSGSGMGKREDTQGGRTVCKNEPHEEQYFSFPQFMDYFGLLSKECG